MGLIETIATTRYEAKPERKDFPKHLRVYALSTCAFCDEAISFLKNEGLAFETVHIDELGTEIKRALKLELKAKFGAISVFPLLIVDGSKPVSGYDHDKWVKILGL